MYFLLDKRVNSSLTPTYIWLGYGLKKSSTSYRISLRIISQNKKKILLKWICFLFYRII